MKIQNITAEADIVTIHFETKLNAQISSKEGSLSPWHRCRDAGWECRSVSMTFGDGGEYTSAPEDAPWDLCDGKHWISHNVPENKAVYQRLVETGEVPQVSQNLWNDTSDLSAFMRAPRDLEGARKHLLREEDTKSPPATLVRKLWEGYSKEWPEVERQLSRMTADQQNRGVGLDIGKAEKATRRIATELWKARRDIPWAFDEEAKVKKELYRECRRRGIQPPTSTSATDPDFLSWCKEVGQKGDFVQALVKSRPLRTAQSTLDTMLGLTKGDGRMDVGLKYHGAHTGRWQSSGLLNLQGLPRIPVAGVNMRSLLIPEQGKKFVIADLSQIEPRCLAWLVGDMEFLKLCKDHMNPYEAHARQTMNYRGNRILSESNPELYKLAKARVIGLGYGCGPEKFQDFASREIGLELSKADAIKVVKDYRQSNPKTQEAWSYLEQSFRKGPGSNWFWTLPSGRTLSYFDRKIGRCLSARVQYHGEQKKIWGGVLVQNIVQALARDVFGDILIRLENHGWRAAFHIHDEVILEVDADIQIQAIEEEMVREIPWASGLPLAVNIQESLNFK